MPPPHSRLTLHLRVDVDGEHLLGPGKVRLLELIEQTGSISAAGRALKMSYSRAWNLIDEMNRTFSQPMIVTQSGGEKGGGAKLTEVGAGVVRTYRAIEGRANGASSNDVRTLTKLLGNSRR